MGPDFLEDTAYIGVLQSINDHGTLNQAAELLDDLEEAQDHVDLEFDSAENVGTDDNESAALDMPELMASIKEVSKGISEKTAQEYARLIKQCETFVHERKLVLEEFKFFCAKPHSQSAQCLAAWIMHYNQL
ncbi:hypothetical protein GGU11DRAFT_760770 [Lentinula aff. detonsa]|nr:hypothetical protein GGU11DRAFT_760770 [Lentinula aff. detonsa]